MTNISLRKLIVPQPLERWFDYWLALVPADIAYRQAAWERRHALLRAKDRKLTYVEISKELGINKTRVAQMIYKASRERHLGTPQPVMRWLADQSDVRDIARISCRPMPSAD